MLTAAEQSVINWGTRGLFINGQWQPSASRAEFAVFDPATEGQLALVPDAGPADALEALAAACAAQTDWAATSSRSRSEILQAAYGLMMDRKTELALLITLEMGKPLSHALAEVMYAAEFFRWFAEEAVRMTGSWSKAPQGGQNILTLKQPVGPCLMITPWNFPLAMGTRKIGPALAAGCTMVLKSAAETPLSMYALAGILEECGLPAGVLNVLSTSSAPELVNPLLADPRLRKLTFTGSSAVGRLLVAKSAPQLLRVSMELGGNAPFLVFEDADVPSAVAGALAAKMRNIGQACTAANRFLVHSTVIDEFTQQLTDKMQTLKIGRGTLPDVEVGPMIDRRQRTRLDALVQAAISDGAQAVTGAQQISGPGCFYEPTVLRGVSATAKIQKEEIFGPVAPIEAFHTEAEAVQLANSTEYGLVSYVYTQNLNRTLRMAHQLESGMVGINSGVISNAAAPFGGIKASGFGREGGAEGISEYLFTKYIGIAD